MSESEVRRIVREYVMDNFLYMRPGFELANDTPLLRRGVIDSMGVMEVVTFLEDTFGVTLRDDDVTEANLGTLDAIVHYVTSGARAWTT